MKVSIYVFAALAVATVAIYHVNCEEKLSDLTAKWKGKLSLLKKQLEERQELAKEMFQKMKKLTQLDKKIGKNTMRADKAGGKLIIQRKGQLFAMKVKEIIERDDNGVEVKKLSLKDVNFEVKKDKNDTTYGTPTVLVEMSAMLPNRANISLKLHMFREAANVTGEDDNVYEVVEGAAKANFEIDWPTDAKKLDLVLAVKCGFNVRRAKKAMKALMNRARKGKSLPQNARSPLTMDVCSNARMTFSPRFKRNNMTWEDMPNEYPKSEELSSDGESIMVLRFNGRKAFYDPIAETGDDIGEGYDGTSAGLSSKLPNTFLTFGMAVLLSIAKLFF